MDTDYFLVIPFVNPIKRPEKPLCDCSKFQEELQKKTNWRSLDTKLFYFYILLFFPLGAKLYYEPTLSLVIFSFIFISVFLLYAKKYRRVKRLIAYEAKRNHRIMKRYWKSLEEYNKRSFHALQEHVLKWRNVGLNNTFPSYDIMMTHSKKSTLEHNKIVLGYFGKKSAFVSYKVTF